MALGKRRNDTVYQKTLSVNDFYLAGDGREWPLGNIQMLGKSNAVDLWLTTEDLPKPENRVTVDLAPAERSSR